MDKYRYSEVEQRLIEQSSIPMAVYQYLDRRVVAIAVSRGMCRIFGFSSLEELYRFMDDDQYVNTHPDDLARIKEAAYCFAREDDSFDVLYRYKVNDNYRVFRARGEHVVKENGVKLVVVRYIDEGPYTEEEMDLQEGLNESLGAYLREQTRRYDMKYDYLTGLPSMTYFFELALQGRREIVEKGKKPAVLFFDLTGMKIYNQKYGFTEGNKLIRGVADVLKKHFTTDNCSRFGGDHFAVFTAFVDLEKKLETVLDELKNVNYGVNLPVRVGIYISRGQIVEPSIACDRAKMACDAIRANYVSGFNYFTDDMQEEEEKRQYIVESLDKALKNEWVSVYYQPVVRAANGRVSDEEALARWNDPERGMLYPADFISVLEDSHVIYKLDLYVVKKVIEKIKDQTEIGLYINPHSVNLSRADFYSCDIVEEIRNLVDEAGIDRKKITIELTESLMAEDIDYIKGQVERFQSLGFKVWMDDYGSGYSSPDILQKIHFDTIKFDMQYMKHFYDGNESRIILSELIKMAVSLDIDTVVEGVETEEQVEFLKEIGCTKLQGFYYCRPLSVQGVFERYRTGKQIGFENPAETEYYTTIGRVNLYDFGSSIGDDMDDDDDDVTKKYFNTMPINIVESDGKTLWMVRSNQSFRKFFENIFVSFNFKNSKSCREVGNKQNKILLEALISCREDGKSVFLDELVDDGRTVHLYVKRIATNPVTGVAAYVIAVLGTSEPSNEFGLTFASVIQELSSDYLYFYYVDLDTEKYVEYGPGNSGVNLYVANKGTDFFAESRKNAKKMLHPYDVDMFVNVFTKENVVKAIDENGSFNLTYRLLLYGETKHASMKIVRATAKGNGIILGVSNIEAHIRQQAEQERVQQERKMYSRVHALSGDIVVIYTVDLITDEYNKFNENNPVVSALLEPKGNRFFDGVSKLCDSYVYEDDRDMFRQSFTKSNVINFIRHNGVYSINVRGLVNGEIVYVNVKAAIISEDGMEQLVVGIVDVDEQVKRELEYASVLTEARNEVNRDALTGVKSKHAYIDVEDEMNRHIEEKNIKEFAVAVFDINGLKYINDTFGHKKGDEYIKQGCSEICEIFSHCPVFRVGGDEFAVIAQGKSYDEMEHLMKMVEEKNEENLRSGGVIVAAGFARFDNDKNMAAVFDRADSNMYENKKYLKNRSAV